MFEQPYDWNVEWNSSTSYECRFYGINEFYVKEHNTLLGDLLLGCVYFLVIVDPNVFCRTEYVAMIT